MKLISQPAGGARETRVESSKWKRVHHLGSMNEFSSFNVKFFKCSLKVTRIKSELNIYRGVHADLSVQKNIWRIRLMIQEFRNHLRNMFKILKVEQRKHRIQGRGLPNNESRQLHNSESAVSRVWANKSTLIGQFSKCFVFRSNTLEVFNYLFILWGTTTCCRNLENG